MSERKILEEAKTFTEVVVPTGVKQPEDPEVTIVFALESNMTCSPSPNVTSSPSPNVTSSPSPNVTSSLVPM